MISGFITELYGRPTTTLLRLLPSALSGRFLKKTRNHDRRSFKRWYSLTGGPCAVQRGSLLTLSVDVGIAGSSFDAFGRPQLRLELPEAAAVTSDANQSANSREATTSPPRWPGRQCPESHKGQRRTTQSPPPLKCSSPGLHAGSQRHPSSDFDRATLTSRRR